MAPSFKELARSRTSVLYEWVGAKRPAEAWGYGELARRKPMGWGDFHLWALPVLLQKRRERLRPRRERDVHGVPGYIILLK